MTKQETYDYLDNAGIKYEITEHKAVFNMEELSEVELPYPSADAKNLFVRDDKRNKYYLITVRGDKRVNLKDFRKAHGTRPLTFASPEELFEKLKLTPGSVTPLGLLNDEEHCVEFWLDKHFTEEPCLIGCHPNDNTATVWLNTKDLIGILEERGTFVNLTELI